MPISMASSVKDGPYEAINTILLQKAMVNDVSSSKNLIQSMSSTNNKIMERSAAPHLGNKIDIRL
ncbi:MAG: putative motility protein [Bacillota bacterium]|nr:putative motility protein [Bacillota bacterium]